MPVLFFDGECVLCNTIAHKIAERNRSGNIRFASLQGSYAKKLPENLQNAETLVFMDGDRFFIRSAAVFEILKHLPAWWRWLRIFHFIPRRLADGLYDFVAKNRIRWFGRQADCRIPPPDLRERFIAD